ncbi:MAG: SDR family NAD(P)-dependent oxidoreductase [Mycobacterium pseudokansasii]|uniref:Putative oxidoreductase n=1 Tax=Mycobacterium pseudokansasii TaxID=2341080 RepID=A0A498R0N5_9MYCO|nr:SDR family NAD(P)-dependent oxidoreductase [Mycobacterium pseudokansasii]MBY0390013.1 SDR family NAD(P)-dependent oxidoreductase [Mycobacterium pseudokansasii]VBA56125.1 putative oxidoreductase [Mycobacterium pseudokansasii]
MTGNDRVIPIRPAAYSDPRGRARKPHQRGDNSSGGLALVTGASSGVGYAFATQFARRGYDLVVADSCDDIHTAADALSGLGTNVRPIQVDARLAERPDVLYRRVLAARQPVVAAALNSPVDRYDLDDSLEDVLQEMVAGIGQTMRLARLLAEGMVVHGRGGIILTVSPAGAASDHSDHHVAVYRATAAFLRDFAQTLQDELGQTGVRVTTLLPEPVGSGSSRMRRAVARVDVALDHLSQLAGAAWHPRILAELARRLIRDDVKSLVRQIISPSEEAV